MLQCNRGMPALAELARIAEGSRPGEGSVSAGTRQGGLTFLEDDAAYSMSCCTHVMRAVLVPSLMCSFWGTVKVSVWGLRCWIF